MNTWWSRASKLVREEGLKWAIQGIFASFFVLVIGAISPILRNEVPLEALKSDHQTLDLEAIATLAGEWITAHIRTPNWHQFIVLFTYVFLLAIIIRGVKGLSGVGRRAIHRREVTSNMGLSDYWANWNAMAGGGPWITIKDRIVERQNKFLYIWGASGAATFGRPDAPLFEIIANFDGSVRILLLNPESEKLKSRAKDIGKPVDEYQDEICQSLICIAKWQEKYPNIRVRLYDQVPSWKLILTTDTAWVQYFRAHINVQDTPVYQFVDGDSQASLYHVFHQEFIRNWDKGKEVTAMLIPEITEVVGPRDIFYPKSKRRVPFVHANGAIEWPMGWTEDDARAWRMSHGATRPKNEDTP